MAFNSFASSSSSKDQVGDQSKSRTPGERNKGKAIMQNYMRQYIIHHHLSPNISSENSYNKQHSPWRATTPATDFFSPQIGNHWWNSTNRRKRWLLLLGSWEMCFQDVHKLPDGSLNTEMDGGGRPGETDKNSTEKGPETDRDLERWKETENRIQFLMAICAIRFTGWFSNHCLHIWDFIKPQ